MSFNSYAAEVIARDKRKEARRQAENSRLTGANRAKGAISGRVVSFIAALVILSAAAVVL